VLKTRDALQVDPQHYRLDFDNDKMRVLRLTLKPSETVLMHDDPDALVVCLKECHVRFTSPNGRSEDIHMEPGASRWLYGETRSEKNLGTKPVEMLFVENQKCECAVIRLSIDKTRHNELPHPGVITCRNDRISCRCRIEF
jgi:hypothetical protein